MSYMGPWGRALTRVFSLSLRLRAWAWPPNIIQQILSNNRGTPSGLVPALALFFLLFIVPCGPSWSLFIIIRYYLSGHATEKQAWGQCTTTSINLGTILQAYSRRKL